MPKLGLSTGINRSGGLVTPGIVTSNLVMKHMYPAGAVQPLSDGAVFLDGTNDYIDMGSSTDIAFTTGYGSVGGWFYISDESSSQCLLSRGVGLTGGGDISAGVCGWSFMYYATNDNIYFDTYYDDGDGTTTRRNTVSATGSIDGNRWYHIMGTRAQASSDTLHTLYIDGVSVATLTVSSGAGNNLNDDDHPFRIGTTKSGGSDYSGYVCNVGFWNAALTQPQVKSIMWKQYADLATSETTSLVSWWNLDSNLTTQGSSSWVVDEANTTFGSNVTPTWTTANTAVIDGQTITLGESGVVSAVATISPVGVYKVNVTVTGYTGSGNIEMPWDGTGSSNMQISANGTYEFYETSADTGWVIYADGGRGATITINSITKANGNIGELL